MGTQTGAIGADTGSSPDTAGSQGHLTGYGTKAYRSYVLNALLLVYILNFLDRGLLGILAEPVRSLSHLEGESDPLYTPSAAEPTHAACVETNPADGDGGTGWLSYDDCSRPRAVKPSAEVDPPRQALPRRGAT